MAAEIDSMCDFTNNTGRFLNHGDALVLSVRGWTPELIDAMFSRMLTVIDEVAPVGVVVGPGSQQMSAARTCTRLLRKSANWHTSGIFGYLTAEEAFGWLTATRTMVDLGWVSGVAASFDAWVTTMVDPLLVHMDPYTALLAYRVGVSPAEVPAPPDAATVAGWRMLAALQNA